MNRCSDTYRLIKDFLDKDRDEDFEKLFGCFGYYPKLVKEYANVARTALTDVEEQEQKPSKPVRFNKSNMVQEILSNMSGTLNVITGSFYITYIFMPAETIGK